MTSIFFSRTVLSHKRYIMNSCYPDESIPKKLQGFTPLTAEAIKSAHERISKECQMHPRIEVDRACAILWGSILLGLGAIVLPLGYSFSIIPIITFGYCFGISGACLLVNYVSTYILQYQLNRKRHSIELPIALTNVIKARTYLLEKKAEHNLTECKLTILSQYVLLQFSTDYRSTAGTEQLDRFIHRLNVLSEEEVGQEAGWLTHILYPILGQCGMPVWGLQS